MNITRLGYNRKSHELTTVLVVFVLAIYISQWFDMRQIFHYGNEVTFELTATIFISRNSYQLWPLFNDRYRTAMRVVIL